MTDTLDETHAQVAFGLLAANPNLTAVFDGVVPNPTPNPPFVLIYTRVGWPRDGVGTSLAGTQVTITTTYTCHCVGLTPAAARAVQMQVRSSLLNARPVIAGRNCSPIKQVDAQDPDRDESTGRLVMDAISIFDFTTTG
jgi:hypothetical protein